MFTLVEVDPRPGRAASASAFYLAPRLRPAGPGPGAGESVTVTEAGLRVGLPVTRNFGTLAPGQGPTVTYRAVTVTGGTARLRLPSQP